MIEYPGWCEAPFQLLWACSTGLTREVRGCQSVIGKSEERVADKTFGFLGVVRFRRRDR